MTVSSPETLPGFASVPAIRRVHWKQVLLACGGAATVLYLGMDVLASLLYSGYSYRDQTISELSAIGAPTRSLWIPLGAIYSVLMLAFGGGVWLSAGRRRSLQVVAMCVIAMGILGLLAWPFAPMHQRAVLAAGGGTLSDNMHLVLGGADSLLFFVSMGFGAAAFGTKFRFYSIATILIVLVAGFLSGPLSAARIANNDATPWVGIEERIAVEGSMLWYAVLAVVLARSRAQWMGARS